MDNIDLIIKIIIVTALLITALFVFTSCSCLQRSDKNGDIIPDNPQDLLYKAVYKTNWLVALSIIGVAFSMAAFLNGSKTAVPIGIGCLTALGLSLAVIRYATWLAGCSMVAAVLIFVATILTKNNALKQIIAGVQKLKDVYVDEDRYAREAANKVLSEGIQDKNTTNLVLKTKDGLKLKGQI